MTAGGFAIVDGIGRIGGRPIPWAEVRHTDYNDWHLRGLHIRFESGWVLSVQWGCGSYCSNHDAGFGDPFNEESPDAEVALWNAAEGGEFLRWPDGDQVQGWAQPDRVLRLIDYLATPGAVTPPLRHLLGASDA